MGALISAAHVQLRGIEIVLLFIFRVVILDIEPSTAGPDGFLEFEPMVVLYLARMLARGALVV
jgi:hypothetical protein